MSAESSLFWQRVFRVKGIWNCSICVGFLVGEDALREGLSAPPTDPIYRALFLALAFVFGLGYWWVGNDPMGNRNIIRMGIVGQLSVFVILAYAVFAAPQPLPTPFLIPGVVDLIFAVAFLVFLFGIHERELRTVR